MVVDVLDKIQIDFCQYYKKVVENKIFKYFKKIADNTDW